MIELCDKYLFHYFWNYVFLFSFTYTMNPNRKKNVIWCTIIFGENCSRLLWSVLQTAEYLSSDLFDMRQRFLRRIIIFSWSHLTKSSTSLQPFELQCFVYVCHGRTRTWIGIQLQWNHGKCIASLLLNF